MLSISRDIPQAQRDAWFSIWSKVLSEVGAPTWRAWLNEIRLIGTDPWHVAFPTSLQRNHFVSHFEDLFFQAAGRRRIESNVTKDLAPEFREVANG